MTLGKGSLLAAIEGIFPHLGRGEFNSLRGGTETFLKFYTSLGEFRDYVMRNETPFFRYLQSHRDADFYYDIIRLEKIATTYNIHFLNAVLVNGCYGFC